jgi:outer membrane murein-binding lipoprotein Lpp
MRRRPLLALAFLASISLWGCSRTATRSDVEGLQDQVKQLQSRVDALEAQSNDCEPEESHYASLARVRAAFRLSRRSRSIR